MCSSCSGDYEDPDVTNGELPEPDMEMERDIRLSGSFAEAQGRLARALDDLTDLALRRTA